VHQIFPEAGNMGKVLPGYLSLWTTNMVQKEGVNVITDAEVKHVERVKDKLVLSLNNGSKVIIVQTFLIKHCVIVPYLC
jgi:programmed cell death 8 (apoptosis-inducing factor)